MNNATLISFAGLEELSWLSMADLDDMCIDWVLLRGHSQPGSGVAGQGGGSAEQQESMAFKQRRAEPVAGVDLPILHRRGRWDLNPVHHTHHLVMLHKRCRSYIMSKPIIMASTQAV